MPAASWLSRPLSALVIHQPAVCIMPDTPIQCL